MTTERRDLVLNLLMLLALFANAAVIAWIVVR